MTRNVGTKVEVLQSFTRWNDGGITRTASAPVPGGCRLSIERDGNGVVSLYSYNTAIAERHPDGTYLVGTRRWTVTTGRVLSDLARALRAAGMAPIRPGAELTIPTIRARVPGRHGGYGIPWHATGWENVPAVVYVPADDPRAVAWAIAVRVAEDAASAAYWSRRAKRRLAYLRREILAERISMSEISELQGLTVHIEPGDTLLLEWAGVPEHGPESSGYVGIDTNGHPLYE